MSREPATRPAESPSSPATLLVSMIVIYLQLILEAGYRFGSRPHQHPHSPYCPIITRPGGVAQGYLRFRPPFRRLAGQTNQSLNRLGAARGAERPSFPAAPTLPQTKTGRQRLPPKSGSHRDDASTDALQLAGMPISTVGPKEFGTAATQLAPRNRPFSSTNRQHKIRVK